MALGCGSASAGIARHADLARLQAEVVRAEGAGELGPSSVRELAGAVLEREIASLHEPLGEFPQIAPCARSVHGALDDVAQGSGEPAAQASLALIDAGFDAPRPDPERTPALLPVVARRAVGVASGERRRAWMLHGDADVRRAALAAAEHSLDARDVPVLLEVAQLDPDERSRELALHALGGIGGSAVVVGLADLYAAASPELRLQIVQAWAQPAALAAGGEQQLLRAAEFGSGTPAVAAALALVRAGGASAGLATTLLARALRGTDAAARLLALYESPWSSPELAPLLIEAQSAEDPAVRLLALLRQAEQAALAAPALEALRALAGNSTGADPSRARPEVALLARATLARSGDAGVKPALLADLKAARARDRMLAALGLVQLGEWGAAAHALADDSPFVRQTVACQMLAEAGPRGAATPLEQSRAEAFGPLASELTLLLVSPDPSGS